MNRSVVKLFAEPLTKTSSLPQRLLVLKEDPEFIVCMDEKPYQLLGEVSDSWAMRPGDNKKVDSEYIRHTTYSIFAFLEPLGGRHHTKVREHRKAANWAEEIKYMVDEMSLS